MADAFGDGKQDGVAMVDFSDMAGAEKPSGALDTIKVPIRSSKIDLDHVEIPGEVLVVGDEMHAHRGENNYVSKIFHGGIHLKRHLPYKDMLVPSGPLSSSFGTMFNLANSTIGAGILGMGSAFRDTGLIFGSLILTIVPFLGGFSTYLLLRACEDVKSRTMVVAAYKIYGLPGSIFVDVITIIANFGALVAYLVLLGDFIPTVAYSVISPTSLIATERLLAMAFAVFFVLPFALSPNVNGLRVYSLLSMILVVFVMIVVVVASAQEIKAHGAKGTNLFKVDLDSFLSLPVVVFAFNNMSAVMPIYVEMENSSISNFLKVVLWSSVFCFMMYEIAGVMSYLTYGDKLKGNLLNSYNIRAPDIVIARAAFAFTIISTYPLVLFPLRISIEHIFLGTKRQFDAMEFYICTLCIIGASYGVAAITDNVELIFGLTGALGSSSLMFIIPALLYMKGVGRQGGMVRIVGAAFILFIGSAILVLGIMGFVSNIS